MQNAASEVIHWTTYIQTFGVIGSTIGTFVYVYFTYHIMKWAAGQGKASLDLARFAIEQDENRRLAALERVRVFARAVSFECDKLANRFHEMSMQEFTEVQGERPAEVQRLLDRSELILDLVIPRATREYLNAVRGMLEGILPAYALGHDDESPRSEWKNATVEHLGKCIAVAAALEANTHRSDALNSTNVTGELPNLP